MLVIRKEQMAAFLRLQLKEFEDKTCERLLKLKPDQCRKLGEKAVRKSIQEGTISATSVFGGLTLARSFHLAVTKKTIPAFALHIKNRWTCTTSALVLMPS